jgi:hypothetical protein
MNKSVHCERSAEIQYFVLKGDSGLPRRYAPRNDDLISVSIKFFGIGLLLKFSM